MKSAELGGVCSDTTVIQSSNGLVQLSTIFNVFYANSLKFFLLVYVLLKDLTCEE